LSWRRNSEGFGAPTFLVDREMFWGNDLLEDALEFYQHAITRT
jgi:2-hydroxychromene-2-carboxylate isomerase